MKKSAIILSLLLVLLSQFFLLGKTRAAEEEIKSADSRVTVFPAKFELRGNPGESLNQSLRITNEDSEDAIFALSVESLSVVGEESYVVLGPATFSPYYDMSKWITFDRRSMEFKPNETRLVNFKIDIPEKIESGARYASLIVSVDRLFRPVGESGAIAKVVSLIMLTVAGDIRDNATVKSFEVEKKASKYNFVFRAENIGNNHIKPSGMIVITSFFGKKIAEIPLDEENILPGRIRRIVTAWQPDRFLYGRYTATIVSHYGEKKQKELNTAVAFNIFDSKTTALIIIPLLLILYMVLKNRRTLGRLIRSVSNAKRSIRSLE